ncbi:MAG: 2,3-bisphosphoglycerate-independent phosphoglycerate mutase [Oligoflexales bacterium]
MKSKIRRVLTVVMDGVGLSPHRFGNAVACAYTPTMDALIQSHLTTQLFAHGSWVGLPSNQDIGNSEVGHNALGSGQTIEQGASLINTAFKDGSLFAGKTWKKAVSYAKEHKGSLHFLGLLSDGNVHSHEQHLAHLIEEAFKEKLPIRVHILTDGRDVADPSAEIYITKLEMQLKKIRDLGGDAAIASGGGRMAMTMDRYNADWEMVRKGWMTHVHGEAERFPDASSALKFFRNQGFSDQNLPPFVIHDAKGPVGKIKSGDSVILFNFRGDRAIQICNTFEKTEFEHFDRSSHPKVFFAGMMQYDGDDNIPKNYLVSPPMIEKPLSEHLAHQGIRQFACSETQKYGHVTYFWNGNRSGYFDKKIENYTEILSDHPSEFHLRPWMKAVEITNTTIKAMEQNQFDCGRINYANGDMVGHTGNFESAVLAVQIIDQQLQRLIEAARKTQTTLIITADHGNCDEMFITQDSSKYPLWESGQQRPPAKTSHTLSKVPLWIVHPKNDDWSLRQEKCCLANVANTILECMGLSADPSYEESLLKRK